MTRLLLIEDDASVRHIVAMLLRHEGFEVIEAEDGVEGLRVLYGTPRPECIVLDLIMPRVSGWRFLDIKRQDPMFEGIPVIVFSASATGIDPKTLEGATVFLPKPIGTIKELSHAILHVLKRTRKTLPPDQETP